MANFDFIISLFLCVCLNFLFYLFESLVFQPFRFRGTWWSSSVHLQQPELETMPFLQNVSEDAQLSGVLKHVIPQGLFICLFVILSVHLLHASAQWK